MHRFLSMACSILFTAVMSATRNREVQVEAIPLITFGGTALSAMAITTGHNGNQKKTYLHKGHEMRQAKLPGFAPTPVHRCRAYRKWGKATNPCQRWEQHHFRDAAEMIVEEHDNQKTSREMHDTLCRLRLP